MPQGVSSHPRQATTYGAVVGQVLARARAERGLSQQALAEKLGAAQSVVSRVESGVLPLTVTTLARWSDALGLDPAAVLSQVKASVLELRRHGFEVLYEAPPAARAASKPSDDGLRLVGAAAVGALIAMVLTSKD